MYSDVLPDRIWAQIRPLMPAVTRNPRARVIDDRQVLSAVLYAMRYGIGWDELPAAVGFGSLALFAERRRLWTREGTWFKIWTQFLRAPRSGAAKIDWARGPIQNRNGQYAPPTLPQRKPRPRETYRFDVRNVTVRVTA